MIFVSWESGVLDPERSLFADRVSSVKRYVQGSSSSLSLLFHWYLVRSSSGSALDLFWSPFFFTSCADCHFNEGFCTNLYYVLSTGVYLRWLLCFWPTLFFRHLQRELQSSLPHFYYILSRYKKTQPKGVERDVPKALQLKSRKAWNACCPCPGHNRLYLWKQFTQWSIILSYR